MASWNMGYQADHLYTIGYYRWFSPVNIYYILTSQGFNCPKIDQNFKACELGFGQGLSINIHAMSTSVKWYGNDFNPSQVGIARDMASQAGLTEQEIFLTDDAFGEFLQRTDLPQFDFICLHGIWSWISHENQQFILDFAKNKLKIGGVLYVSYNTAPGHTTFAPVRHLMSSFNESFNGSDLPPAEKCQNVTTFLKELLDTSPLYAEAVKNIKSRVGYLFDKDYKYLLAEYLNQYWDVCYFDKIASKMDEAKLTFACSANISELIDNINLTPDQQRFLAPYKGTFLGEVTRDFILNQQFRLDLFIKGPRTLSAAEREERLNAIYLFLGKSPLDISTNFNTKLGKATLSKELHEPILQLLFDYQPHSIGEIKEKLTHKLSSQRIEDAIMLLLSQSYASVVRNPEAITEAEQQRCLAFNRQVLDKKIQGNIEYLACPLFGGGCFISLLDQDILNAFRQHQEQFGADVDSLDIPALAEALASKAEHKGHVSSFMGKTVHSHTELVSEMGKFIEKFKRISLPFYRGLRVI